MLAGQRQAAVDLAQRFVMLGARLLAPHAEAAMRERHAVPADRNAVFEFARILPMQLGAVLHRFTHALLRGIAVNW